MATFSGQKTVTAAGTAEQIASSQLANCPVMVKALTTNTGLVYIGQVAGDVASDSGMPLAAGEVLILDNIGNLNELWIDSAVDGEGAAWLLLSA